MVRTGYSLTYRLRLLENWQALFGCFAAGALASLAFAPHYVWVTLPLALPFFYLLLEASPRVGQAVLRAFIFGYGYCMAGTYWISNALAVDMEKFGWMIPLCVLGLSALMAVPFLVLGWLSWRTRTGDALADFLRFCLLWVGMEYVRTLGLFAFPWNMIGHATLFSAPLMQLAAWTGPYGLSFLVMLWASLPILWLQRTVGRGARIAFTLAAIGALAAGLWLGHARIPPRMESTPTRVRLVQPNIAQDAKWTQAGRIESLRVHARLSQLPSQGAHPSIVIWSETAMPFTLYPRSIWPGRLSGLLPPNTTLITGAVRGDDHGLSLQLWNSLVVIRDGAIRDSYDKHQLVPFGEFVPLRAILPLEKITPGSVDFSRGQGVRTLRGEGIPPYSPLICYEAIFPWIIANRADRPDWLLNITNDAWYGDSPGPYQHFDMSRLRAVEQGLPLVRVANTGISGVIDPYGRVTHRLALNQRGILDANLPAVAAPTFYGQHGELPIILALALLWLGTAGWVRLRNR